MQEKNKWLEAGQSIITEQGKKSLTIVALCNEVGLTKGAFYFQFKSLTSYIEALEAYLEKNGSPKNGQPISNRINSLAEKKKPWFAIALNILKSRGYAAITLEELNAQMGVSKGAFYYLFKSRDGFVQDLLNYWEQEELGSIFAIVNQEQADFETVDAILHLSQQLSHRREIDIQIRAWALADVNVARFQTNLDALQMNASRVVIKKLFPKTLAVNQQTIDGLAKIAYFSYIGSQQFLPKVTEKEWVESLKYLLPLFSTDLPKT